MIRLSHVTKEYKGKDGKKITAVSDVSLEVPAGKLLALLGGSGSGKTTTLEMINRLTEPTNGQIWVDGQEIRAVSPVELRRKIGYVIQGSGLFPHMTVRENIALIPTVLGWKKDDIDKRVNELLQLVKLEPDKYQDKLPREMSGGEQQRVGFARAMAARPKVMLLDEPFGALDPVTRDGLRNDFLTFRKAEGLTAVMVTHDMVEALLSADLIAVMKKGRLLRLGTPHELTTDPRDDFVKEMMTSPRRQAAELARLNLGGVPSQPPADSTADGDAHPAPVSVGGQPS